MESEYMEVILYWITVVNRKFLYAIVAAGFIFTYQGVYNLFICRERKVKLDIKKIAQYQETLKKDGIIGESKKL